MEECEHGIFSHLFSPGDLVFDIGACLGKMTDYFLSGGTRVIAVEPEDKNFATLTGKYADSPSVSLVHKAVGGKAGTKSLHINNASQSIHTFVPETFWGSESAFKGTKASRKQPAKMTTLDELIHQFGLPAFCKIDVEGYEKWVLDGLTQPIRYISFEISRPTLLAGWVEECFDRILEICPAAMFNFVDDESNAFEVYDDYSQRFWYWADKDRVLQAIHKRNTEWDLFWGNAYVNMEEACQLKT